MKYYKKLNAIGEIEWLVKTEEPVNPNAIEITEKEYQFLIKKNDLDSPIAE